MLSTENARRILSDIVYRPGWRIDLVEVFNLGATIFGISRRGYAADGHTELGRYAIQIVFQAPNADDPESGELFEQRGRKWLLWDDISPTQLVTTVAQAISSAETHEFREFFRYKGAMVLNPHFEIEELVKQAMRNEFFDHGLEDANKL